MTKAARRDLRLGDPILSGEVVYLDLKIVGAPVLPGPVERSGETPQAPSFSGLCLDNRGRRFRKFSITSELTL
jgi:hypothetical protein